FYLGPEPETGPPPPTSGPAPAPFPWVQPPQSVCSTGNPVPEGWFDVTEYGAVADGETDNQSAFLAAWDAACDHIEDSTLFIPEGTFFVGPIVFAGPCHNNKSPKVILNGTLIAPTSLQAFKKDTWIMFRNLHDFHVCGGTGSKLLDGQAEKVWKSGQYHEKNYPRPVSLRFMDVLGGSLSNIRLSNSKFFHTSLLNCENILVEGLQITAPADSSNTDGIHLSRSTNITIASSIIGVGDDCISVGPGNTDVHIFNISCGPGHGISVGSLGKYQGEGDVARVRVENCTIIDTANGIRIKTWPGSTTSKALNLTFENIVMNNASRPIIIDQEYCPHQTCKPQKPSKVKLNNIVFRNIVGTSNTKPAVTLKCSSIVPCENVHLEDINLIYINEDPEEPHEASLTVKGAINGLQISNFQD
ncbi:Glycoside hydrolase, family 28, partial [Dillenia turbinata]